MCLNKQRVSKQQYINYIAVDVAEKLMKSPTQADIELIEKKLQSCTNSFKKHRHH